MNRPLAGHSVLVVEDEPLIAFDIEAALARAGARVLVSNDLRKAVALLEDDRVSAAIVDRKLRDGDSAQLCERLQNRGIPFVIYTGFGQTDEAWQRVPHVAKPANPEVLVTTVVGLLSSQPAAD
jgi:DNA-binding response OmpR family regulator